MLFYGNKLLFFGHADTNLIVG